MIHTYMEHHNVRKPQMDMASSVDFSDNALIIGMLLGILQNQC